MNTNNIDEIIIKGLQELQRRNEILACEAKPRVWQAIEKPKERKSVNWWLVSTMAAAISFFLISTFLFLRLETQKKELLALQSYMINEISPKESTYPKVLPEVEEIIERKPLAIRQSSPIVNTEKSMKKVEANNFERDVDEEIEVFDPIIPEPNLALLTLLKPEIDLPEKIHLELNTQVTQIPELIEETFPKPKSKKQPKLRLKFGNGSKDHDYQTTYALNIKL